MPGRTSLMAESNEPLVLVTCDSHAGPLLGMQLREYCPSNLLDVFDEHVRQVESNAAAYLDWIRTGASEALVEDSEGNYRHLSSEATSTRLLDWPT